jgi:alpha-2-macroglobulin
MAPKAFPLKLFAVSLLLLFSTLAACRRSEPATPTPQATSLATPTIPATAVPPAPTSHIIYEWPPQLIYSSPAPGEEALLDGAITLRFDQPMDQPSVEAAFTIRPASLAAGQRVDGHFSWPRPDTLIFTPRAGLQRQLRYQVQVATSARAENGQTLREPVNLQLETVGNLEVGQVIPADGTQGVQTDSAVTVLFNRPVVPLVAAGRQAELPQPLRFEPPVGGRGEWVSTSIYRFVPDEPLAGATRYQVTIEPGLQDVNGGVLTVPYHWTFTTLSPAVVTVEPTDEARRDRLAPGGTITVTFNMPMDRAATEAAVNLEPGARLHYEWSDDDRRLSLTPGQPLDLATTYELTISQAAAAANGRAALERPLRYTFTTVPLPAVLETRPRDGSTADRYQRGVSIGFASPMDLDTLENRVQIEPAPDRVSYYYDEWNNTLHLDFELERNSQYTVTVPGSAADVYGNRLGEDLTWRFTTPPAEPVASFNLPRFISQLSAGRPSQVEVIHRNVSRLDVSLYEIGLPLGLFQEPYLLQEYEPPGEPRRNWQLATATAQDQAGVQTVALADGNDLPNGVYLLQLGAPEIGAERRWWQNQSNLLIVADTNLVVKEMVDAVYVWATDLASGEPVAGRSLALYGREGRQIGTAATTGRDGLARFDYRPADNYLQGVIVVSNEPGQTGFGVGGSNWNEGVTPWQLGIAGNYQVEAGRFVYLYTDRPIYRPGDTVFYRVIARANEYGRYALAEPGPLTLHISPESYYDTPSFSQQIQVQPDAQGEFSGEFQLPAEAQLGTYHMSIGDTGVPAWRSFSVAEYRAPEFLVTATAAQAEAFRGEPVDVTIEAGYFFGGPASDLEVNWTVYEQAYHLPWEGRHYSFSDSGEFFYEVEGLFRFGGAGPFGNYVTGGQGRTDADGRLEITLPADLLAEMKAGSRQVTVEANLLDLGNFPMAARTRVVFHAAAGYAGIAPATYVGAAGRAATVDLISVDWERRAQPGTALDVVFYRREWQPIRDEQFNQRFTRWEPSDTEVERTRVTTDGQGRAQASFTPTEGGTYLAVATLTDAGGRSHTSSTYLWVASQDFVGWRTDPRERRMELVADKQAYRVGETAHILVQSPFAGPVQAWLTIERGGLLEQRLVTLESNSDVLALPVTADFAPNVFVTLVAVKGVDETNPHADIRLGVVELVVSPEPLALNVSLTPRSSFYQPRETAVYDVLITDYQGNPVAATFSVALVDLAVLMLKPDNAPPILEAFYERQPYRSQTGSGLFYSGEGLEAEIPLEQMGLGGGGGDFAATEAAVLRDPDGDEIRQDFRDTAHWEGRLTTGADGRATVEIPLPDNLTTWRLSSKAVTTGSLVGQGYADVTVTLPLLIRPVTPRFFTVGDSLKVGAVVHNNRSQTMDVTVTLEAAGLTLTGAAEQTVILAAGSRQLVQWQVTVDDAHDADLTFRASGGTYRDATRPTFGIGPDHLIPIYRYSARDLVGTAGVLEEAGRRVEALLLPPDLDLRQGSLQLHLSPSLAAALLESLDSVAEGEYRPFCAHVVVDYLLPRVATARALRLLNLENAALEAELVTRVPEGIQQVERLQKRDGGWGWCDAADSDEFLAAYVLLGLVKAQEAGYLVNETVLRRGLDYLNGRIQNPARLRERFDVNRQAFLLYVLAEAGRNNQAQLDALVGEHRHLLDAYARALLALAYAGQAEASNNQQALLADLNDSVVLSATGAHWQDAEHDWRNLSSNIRATAISLSALARLEPQSPLAAPAVSWLMVARNAARWPTTHETVWSILALTDWMVATAELNADYSYQVSVNGALLAGGRFRRDNLTQSARFTVAVADLWRDEPNFLDFRRDEGVGRLYYTAYLESYVEAAAVPAANRGFIVERAYYDAACDPEAEDCRPIDQIRAGRQVRVELTLIVPHDRLYVILEDHFPAGAEALDPGLETSAGGVGGSMRPAGVEYRPGYWGWWLFNRIEYRDDRVVFGSTFLPAGTYQYSYILQTNLPGVYQVMPANAREEFFAEVFGRSEGVLFTILE